MKRWKDQHQMIKAEAHGTSALADKSMDII